MTTTKATKTQTRIARLTDDQLAYSLRVVRNLFDTCTVPATEYGYYLRVRQDLTADTIRRQRAAAEPTELDHEPWEDIDL